MKKISENNTKNIVGGKSIGKGWHWFCGVNRYSSKAFGSEADASYWGGVHYGRYRGKHKTSVFCVK